MGFFSQCCHACGHSVLSHYSTIDINDWMRFAVTISPEGDLHMGEHDGYGSVGGAEYAIGDRNTVYHRACWEVAGKPMDYQGESPYAEDQGYFFDDDAHAMPDPRKEPAK